MRPEDIHRMLRQPSFRPFRLYILENTVYEIRHPELVIVERSTLNIHFPAADASMALGERYVTVALIHITRLEPIFSAALPSLP